MKFIATFTILLSSTIAIASAQQDSSQHGAGIYITNPVLGTKLNGGTVHTITWDITNTNVSNIDTIELRNGESNNLKLVNIISSQAIPISNKKYEWNISPNTTTGTSYVLAAKSAAGISYSAYFTILGIAPGIGPSGDAISATSSSSSSSSVSGSGSGSGSGSSSSASGASAPASSPSSSSSSSSIPVFNDYITASQSQATSTNNAVASASGSHSANHRTNSTSVSTTLKTNLFGFVGAVGMTILLA